MDADNNAIDQSQQLLKIIQSHSDSHPDGIIFEPVGGTALPQVARAAGVAGIGWVVLNREVEYVADLRKAYRIPAFSLTTDHEEVGRIQGRQFAALLPKGGAVLYIQGPSESLAAKQRTSGMQQRKPANITLVTMKGKWTGESATRAVSSWMRLSTSQKAPVDLVCAQNDAMAMGARKAFQEQASDAARARWMNLPFLGVDGLRKTGQAFVRSGLLTGTVVVPPNTTLAMEMLFEALQRGSQPAPLAFTVPEAFPTIDEMVSRYMEKSRALTT